MTAALRALPSPWHLAGREHEGLSLRPATADDVLAMAALKRRVESTAYAHLGSAEALRHRLRSRCSGWFLLSRLAEGDLVLVAEAEGGLVGLAAASIEGPRTVRLHSTYVEKAGHGVGRALTSARLEAARRLGVDRVVADSLVGADLAERRLRSLGLVVTGCSPSLTFPGVDVTHWSGKVGTALARATG